MITPNHKEIGERDQLIMAEARSMPWYEIAWRVCLFPCVAVVRITQGFRLLLWGDLMYFGTTGKYRRQK